MGLDQHAGVKTGKTYIHPETGKRIEEVEELAYWRKHPNLQGFMEAIWNERGCPDARGGGFNCVDLELTLEDIDALEVSVKGEELPETGGFFFGDCADEHYKEEDLEFCTNARKALADGQTVVYSSWW